MAGIDRFNAYVHSQGGDCNVDCRFIRFSRHAIERMFRREIPPDIVSQIISSGEIVATYLDDTPYPSVLMLGFQEGRPVHVVVAHDEVSGVCHVVTVYHPDPELWTVDFKSRRKS